MARFKPGFGFDVLLRRFAQVLYLQVLDDDNGVAFADAVRGLVHEIFSHIGDVLVQFADFGFPFLPVDRELLLASQPTLQPCQTLGLLLCCNGPFLFGFIALLVLRQGLV